MKNSFKKSLLFLSTLLTLIVNATGVTPVRAANTLVVNVSNDSGAGSLRQALADAAPGDTVTFDSSLSGQTIRLASTLALSKNVTIDGSSLASQITISGDANNSGTANAGDVRVFSVNGGVTATLDSLTISRGYEVFGAGIYNLGDLTVTNSILKDNSATRLGGGDGGGIYNLGNLNITDSIFTNDIARSGGGIYLNGGTQTVSNSTLSANSATSAGGAIFNYGGITTVSNSTFSGNHASDSGGGIYNLASLTVTNSTFSANSATSAGGGIFQDSGTATIVNSIISNSTAGGNCAGGTVAGSSNLGDDATCGTGFTNSASIRLGTLGNYGGATETYPLLAGSAALGAGDAATCAAAPVSSKDQRGQSRPQGDVSCDIGAYESTLLTDITAPTLNAFVRQTPAISPTNTNVLVFRAVFSEDVLNVDITDFAVEGSTTATVSDVNSVDEKTYDVTVSGGNLADFNGIVGLNLRVTQNIKDLSGNALPLGEPATDESYVLDHTVPEEPFVNTPSYIDSAAPTISGTAEPGTHVHIWYLDNQGGSVQICEGIADGSGAWSCHSTEALPEGEVELHLNAYDPAGNPSATATYSFTVDLTKPEATINSQPANPTNSMEAAFTFSATDNFSPRDELTFFCKLEKGGTTVADWEDCSSNPGTKSYTNLDEGTYLFSLNVVDSAGNELYPDSLKSYAWTIDTIAPTINSVVRTSPAQTKAASVDFTVTFSESVTGVNTSPPYDDFSLFATGVTGASIAAVSGSGQTYTVTVNTGLGNGTIRLDVVDNDSIQDAAHNSLASGFTTGETYTIAKSNGLATLGVFRPSNGLLYLKNSNGTGFADLALNYGIPGDYPVVGDWDGNGTVTIGVYRNGYFYLRNSNSVGFADLVFAFGQLGDQPVAGDWNGDGLDTIGVYRPATGQFLLRNSNSAGTADMSFYLGNVGDVGIAGDWDGDGRDTAGVFRPINGVIFLKNTNETGYADVALNYGIPGDKPVTGDWNNDSIDTIGVYRNGQFLLRDSNTVGFADIAFGLGIPGDMPIAGNWDGLP